jgi:uncharacterized protein with WD repeat
MSIKRIWNVQTGSANEINLILSQIMQRFDQIDASLSTVEDVETWPYACLSDSTTQTIASTTVAYPITFDTNESLNHITHSIETDTSKVYLTEAGTYLITFSAVGKSTAPNKSLHIWFTVNGENVPRSNTVSKFVGSGNERIITITLLYTFAVGDYFELYMRSDDVGTILVATEAQTSPTRPASPSIILTVNKISN